MAEQKGTASGKDQKDQEGKGFDAVARAVDLYKVYGKSADTRVVALDRGSRPSCIAWPV